MYVTEVESSILFCAMSLLFAVCSTYKPIITASNIIRTVNTRMSKRKSQIANKSAIFHWCYCSKHHYVILHYTQNVTTSNVCDKTFTLWCKNRSQCACMFTTY